MKKIFLLLLISTMLTGCTIEYNLTIEDNDISEETNFVVSSSEYQSDERISSLYEYPYSIFINEFIQEEDGIYINEDFTYYDKSISNENDNYNILYNAKYTKSNYQQSRMLNTAFTAVNVDLTGSSKYLTARDLTIFTNYNSYNISTVTVNIKLSDNYEVKDHNASSVNNNVYTWNFNKNSDNFNDIILEFTKKRTNSQESTLDNPNNSSNSDSSESKKSNSYALYIVLAIIIVVILAGYKMFNKMKEKNNQTD